MAEANEIPDKAMSELQLCPPPPPDELDRLLFHLPLEDFGRRLQRASQAVFPNDMKSRYTKVHVLLLCWEDGDPKLPVFQELMNLENIFRKDYNFETEVWKIPSQKSHHALSTKILNFVELEGDNRDCLKIVYYGGHGLLAANRQLLWSNIPDKNDSGYRSIKWFAIQATLEDAEGDVLLLLDCCAAGTAATDNGHGVTELLGACAFNNTANGVGEFSFTDALCKELWAFRKVPSFTVGRLYNNLLRRIQLSPSHMTIQKAPVHIVLTHDYELPRSIQLSAMPRQLENAEDSKTLPQFESTSSLPNLGSTSSRLSPPTIDPMQTSSRGSSVSKVEEAEADSSSQERSDSSRTSILLDTNTYPRIMLSVQLSGNVRPDQLSEDLFLEWLRMIPAVVECIKVEAGWVSLSTLIIVSVPMSIWKYIEGHPAIRLVGIIRSPNLLAPKQVEQREAIASMSTSVGNDPQESKEEGRKEIEMERKRVKVDKEIMERRMEMWKMEKENMERRMEMEKMEKENMERRMEIKKIEKENMEWRMKRKEMEIEKIEKENMRQRMEIENMKKEKIERRIEMEKMEKENIERRIEMEKMEEEKMELRMEMEKMDKEKMELRMEMEKMDKEKMELRIEIEKRQKENIALRMEIENMDMEMEMEATPSMSAAAADDPQENKGKGMDKLEVDVAGSLSKTKLETNAEPVKVPEEGKKVM